MDFRERFGDERFSDVSFADLQIDPVHTLERAYESLGLNFTDTTARSVETWAVDHQPGTRGGHNYDLVDFGLTPVGVRERFADYVATYDASA
jgi:hypothetical protein